MKNLKPIFDGKYILILDGPHIILIGPVIYGVLNVIVASCVGVWQLLLFGVCHYLLVDCSITLKIRPYSWVITDHQTIQNVGGGVSRNLGQIFRGQLAVKWKSNRNENN